MNYETEALATVFSRYMYDSAGEPRAPTKESVSPSSFLLNTHYQ